MSEEGSRSWFEKLSLVLSGEPGSRAELIELLRASEQRNLLDAEALGIIEGALLVSDMQAREIMVPRTQVVFVQQEMNFDEVLPVVIESGHSRFPVVTENPDDVVGILMAKDLLPLAMKEKGTRFKMRDLLRPCTAIPESKRLNVLLEEFRTTRNHLAVVYDEYGGVSGIITIEDVLEQIVGDIEDEYDFDEEDFIKQHSENSFNIKALMPIIDFNDHFHCKFSHEEFDTIGGMIIHHLGHLPEQGEQAQVGGFDFKVVSADGRKIKLLQMTRSGEK
jgi:magnesium and cobalt transporter|tara:strand:+ start:1815 stop:2645 length:831 start_codon:yes stop_codon:yes gene_type:complete